LNAAAASHPFTRADILRKAAISERQLRGWERAGLVAPADAYGFSQLNAIKTLASFKAAHVPSARIRKTIEAVRKRGVADPLAETRLYVEGRHIRIQVGDERLDPLSGQMLLDLDGNVVERVAVLPPRILEDNAAKQRKLRSAEEWFLRGVEMEQSGAPPGDIIDTYMVAISLDPSLAAASVNLGTIYFNQRDWVRAEKYYTRAIDAMPDYALAHFNIGNLYDELGNRDQAHEHYSKALELDPNYSDAHYNIALLYQATGQAMKAMRHWRAYLKLDPRSSWADVARRELDKLYKSTVFRGNRVDPLPGAQVRRPDPGEKL